MTIARCYSQGCDVCGFCIVTGMKLIRAMQEQLPKEQKHVAKSMLRLPRTTTSLAVVIHKDVMYAGFASLQGCNLLGQCRSNCRGSKNLCTASVLVCVDSSSGKDYEHCRQWVIDRLELLCSVFAVELCAYSVMANHFHIVLRLAPAKSDSWSPDQVMARWEKLYGVPTPVAIGLAPEADETQKTLALEMIEVRRQRLCDLSWFMKCLNEHIARRANLEDHCTGAFWDRFLFLQNLAYITSM